MFDQYCSYSLLSILEVLWIVDTVCHVKVQVQNLLPAELVVHSLVLHTEGCDFEVGLNSRHWIPNTRF